MHNGHVLVARAALEELSLDRLFIIPAARSPFKPEQQSAPAAARLRLLRLAFADFEDCQIDPQEIERDGISYSIDTIRTYAGRHPEAKLLPTDSAERAQALRWLLFLGTEIYPVVEINDYPERFTADPESDPKAMRENARRIWRDRWTIVENNVSGDPYLLPSGCTLADFYIAVVSRWAQQDDWRPAHIPKVERIAEAVAQREACAWVWKRNFG